MTRCFQVAGSYAERYLTGVLFDHPLRYDAVRLQVAWSG